MSLTIRQRSDLVRAAERGLRKEQRSRWLWVAVCVIAMIVLGVFA